jgi:predicted  nucleic acid-binding Zn-ribbon protein
LSGVQSDLTELRFETHQQAQDALYASADSLCHIAEFYRKKTLSLEEANSKLEQQQQAAEKQAKKTTEELTNLRHEYRSLEQTLSEAQDAVSTWMEAKREVQTNAKNLF